MQQYSQFKAMLAVTKASLKAIFRSPQSVFFSMFFPIVLIVIFGAISNGGGLSVDVGIDKGSDTSNAIYYLIKNSPVLNIINTSQDTLEDKLKKGKITALISINKIETANGAPKYDVHLKSTSATQQELPALEKGQKKLPVKKIVACLETLTDPDRVADLVSWSLLRGAAERQTILETIEVEARLKHLIHFLMAEINQRRKDKIK